MTTEIVMPRSTRSTRTRTFAAVLAATLFCVGLPFATPAVAQVAPPVGVPAASDLSLIDRVLAVAGDSIILEGELRAALRQVEAAGATLPAPGTPEFEEFSREALDQMIDQTLMIQAAGRDSLLTVDDLDVEPRVDAQIENLIQNAFGSREAYLLAIQGEGFNEASYREWLRVDIKKELLIQSYTQARSRAALTAPVSDEEVRERFESGPIGQRPETFTFLTVFITEQATDSAWAEAEREVTEALRQLVEDSADFRTLARTLSDDSASAEEEGSLGWVTQSTPLVEEFQEAVFTLPEGELSAPVRSPHGFHLIRVDRIRAGERLVRHILFAPERTEADVDRLRERAEEALARARAGEPFPSLQEAYGDPLASDTVTWTRADLVQSQFFSGFVAAFDSAQAGEILGPLEGPGPLPRTVAMTVVELIEHRPEGEWDFEEIKEQIRSQLVQEKIRESLIRDLRDKMHVEVRWGG